MNYRYRSFLFLIDSLKFQTLRCLSQSQKQSSFQVELSCSTSDDDNAVEFCAMPTVKPQSRFANSSIQFDYVLDYNSACSPKLEDLQLVKFVADRYLILYGCTNFRDEHEEGAWILGSKSNTTVSLQLLNEALSFLKNSTSKVEDFNIYNSSKTANLSALNVSS